MHGTYHGRLSIGGIGRIMALNAIYTAMSQETTPVF